MPTEYFVYYRGELDEHGRTPTTPGYTDPASDRERSEVAVRGYTDIDALERLLTLSPYSDSEARGVLFTHMSLFDVGGTEGSGTARPGDGTLIHQKQKAIIGSNIDVLNSRITSDELGDERAGTSFFAGVERDSSGRTDPSSDLNRELEIWAAVSNWPLHMRSSTTEDTFGDYMTRVDGSVYGAPGTFLDAGCPWMHMSIQQYKTWDFEAGAYKNPGTDSQFGLGVPPNVMHASGMTSVDAKGIIPDGQISVGYSPYTLSGDDGMALQYASSTDFQESTVKCYSELVRVGQTWCLTDTSIDSAWASSADTGGGWSALADVFNGLAPAGIDGDLPVRQYFFASHMLGPVCYYWWNGQGVGSRLSGATNAPDTYGWYHYMSTSTGPTVKTCWRHVNKQAPDLVKREWLPMNDGSVDDGHAALEDWRDYVEGGFGNDAYSFDWDYDTYSSSYSGTRTDEDGRSPLRNSLRNYFRWSSPDLTVDFFRTMMRTAMMHEAMGVVGFSVEELRARAQVIDDIGVEEDPSADAYIQAYTEYLSPIDVEFGTSLTDDTIFMMEVLRGLGVDVSSVSDVELAGSHANTYESPATSAVEIYHFAQMAHYVSSLKDALEDPSPLPRSMKTKMQKSRPIRMSTLSSVAPPSGEITSTTSTSGESGGY